MCGKKKPVAKKTTKKSEARKSAAKRISTGAEQPDESPQPQINEVTASPPAQVTVWQETEEDMRWLIEQAGEIADFPIKQDDVPDRGAAFEHFLLYLNSIPAGAALPQDFNRRWDEWLGRIGREEIDKLPPKDRADEQIGEWVKLVWVTADFQDANERQTGHFINHDEKPIAAEHPFRAIVINEKGQWRMPADQRVAAIHHPYTRAFCDSLPSLSDKTSILNKIRWAAELEANASSSKGQLADAARQLQAAFSAGILECLPVPTEGFIQFDHLPDEAPFWQVIDAAIGFGRSLQHQEIFGDGRVESVLRRGVRVEMGITLRQLIARLMDDYFNEKGTEATSAKLLIWLGTARPGSDSEPIHFPDRRGSALRNLCWPEFDQTVKNEKRSRKGQG